MRFKTVLAMLSAFTAGVAATPRARSDEGMWLFNRLPLKSLEAKYGFRPPAGWAEKIMRSCVRISRGGSGSIVSSRGLVLTNHHVVSGILQDLSTAQKNLLAEGFRAESPEAELRCPNTEVLALEEIVDVTERVSAAVRPDMSTTEAEKARRAEIARIEQESKASTGLHSEVVTLYRGGEYHLYRYRRYEDVRLVFAPEVAVAFFGGDADNFEFPRFCLDMALLRLWKDGKPAQPAAWLPWSRSGVQEGDLTFVAGHPGSTQRLNTVDHLRYLRDTVYPNYLESLYRREIALQQYSLRGEEEKRRARDDLFSIQNSRKALRGIQAGLLDPRILEAKERSEAELRSRVAADDSLGASLEDWDRIASALDAYTGWFEENSLIGAGRAFWSDLFTTARGIVRMVEESAKPNEERLSEFRESALPRTRLRLLSPAPIHADLEEFRLTDSFTHLAQALGAEHPITRLVLAGRSPAERAHELVSGCTLADVKAREALIEGGVKAVRASDDPMVRLALALEPRSRALRERFESEVKEVRTQAYAHISKAVFAISGTDTYPDATFTLRLAYGVVKGWEEAGRRIPAFTSMAGVFDRWKRAAGEDPYELPPRWLERRDAIAGKTPLDFVSTADIIGGNSGSPVIDRSGELVGLIFDGNIHGLVLDIVYTEEKARAVSVDARAIVEALRSVYGLDGLVRELLPE